MMRDPAQSHRGIAVGPDGQTRTITRSLPEECAVAMVYDGSTQAVMMATPADLEDFAIGFSLSEGFVSDPAQIARFELVAQPLGIEARMWLQAAEGQALSARRRSMAGPVGCGLCGIDSLEQALRDLPDLSKLCPQFTAAEIAGATAALRGAQPLHDRTHAVHAAGFIQPSKGLLLVREDVGRHNALDKLIGALARSGLDPSSGAIVMTSRLSIELVQKAAMARCPVLAAISAPTAHALRMAEAAGLTLAGFAGPGGFDLFTHPERIVKGAADVA